jgi:hypothetical protein
MQWQRHRYAADSPTTLRWRSRLDSGYVNG